MKFDYDKKEEQVIFMPESTYDIYLLGKIFGNSKVTRTIQMIDLNVTGLAVNLQDIWLYLLSFGDEMNRCFESKEAKKK